MKKLKSVIASLLSIMLLSSCAGSGPELLDFIGDTSSKQNFDGYTVKIYQSETDEDERIELFGYNIGSIEEAALKSRIAEIEKDYNITILFNNDFDRESIRLKLSAGDFDADIVYYEGFGAMQDFAKAGFLCPMTDFPDQIDLSDAEKYGGANVLEGAMINSVPYAVQPVQWPGFQALNCFFLVYNSELFAQNGLTDLHEFYENETWTWDTFETELLEKAASLNLQTTDGPMYTLSTHRGNLFSSLVYSNNTQYITKNEAGENVVNPYPTTFVHALEKGLEWGSKYNDTIDLSQGFWEIDDFLMGNALTTLATSEAVTTGGVAYNKYGSFEHRIMPFPVGSDAPYGMWSQYMQRIYGMGIPVSSKEPEIAATVISALFEPLEGMEDLYEYYSNYTFNTQLDADIYMAAGQFVRYDYTFDGGSDLNRTLSNTFGSALKSGKSAQEIMDSQRNAMVSLIENYMLENYDYMYENYYYQFAD